MAARIAEIPRDQALEADKRRELVCILRCVVVGNLSKPERACRSQGAEDARDAVTENQSPRNKSIARQKIHRLKEYRHKQRCRHAASNSKPKPVDIRQAAPVVHDAHDNRECSTCDRPDNSESRRDQKGINPRDGIVDDTEKSQNGECREGQAGPANPPHESVSYRTTEKPELFLYRHRSAPRNLRKNDLLYVTKYFASLVWSRHRKPLHRGALLAQQTDKRAERTAAMTHTLLLFD